MAEEAKNGNVPEGTDYRPIYNILNNAKNMFFEFDEHKYEAEIIEMRIGEYVLIKIKKPYQGLVNVPPKYEYCKLRVFSMQGPVNIFPVRLLQKKLPGVIISFPDKEEPGFVRGTKRLFIRMSTPIILRKRDNVLVPRDTTGMGIITDLSDGGCSLFSKVQLTKGDKVRVFVNLSHTKEPRNVEMFSIVRRVSIAEDGQGDYGLEWLQATDQIKQDIKTFLSRHPSLQQPPPPPAGE
ncbi:MAG: PilZ domain-containing protein [Nitrospinae bacterium]|nr:PilZ domain-containing protein [Nitrospinota bacterium]